MNKWQFSLFALSTSGDLEKDLNDLGQLGWRPSIPVMTPFGPKFVMERQLDEPVTNLTEVEEKKRMDDLYSKFGL